MTTLFAKNDDSLFSACVNVIVNTVVKSGPFNAALTYGLCGLDIVSYYLCATSLGRALHQTAARMPECFS